MTIGGGSAERRAQELSAAGDASAAAWVAGAQGERRVAAQLTNLREAWTVLHDRLLRPGRSEANLDHVVIGPGGMFLVDSKNRAGRVTEHDGGLFQHTTDGNGPRTVSLAAELKKVHGMAAYMAVESGLAVTPVLCLAGAQEARFGAPRMVRGVWVVPASHVVRWLEGRPQVFDREQAARAVTRAMTDFPSTTTDPGLLAAIGQSRAASQRGRTRPQRDRAQHRRGTPRRRSLGIRVVGFLGMAAMATLAFVVLMALVPALLTAGVQRMAGTPAPDATASAPSVSVATTAAASTAKNPPAKAATAAKPVATPKTPRPPDCANASGAQIAKIINRKVQPVAVGAGCAWGTRLDDASTILVTINMKPSHAAHESNFEASAKQRRVVYGTAYDPGFDHATALWVAAGQPVVKGKSPVAARAATTVVVSREDLQVSDDRARQMALAIAAAANRP